MTNHRTRGINHMKARLAPAWTWRAAAAALAAGALWSAAPAALAEKRPVAVTCTNPVSGTRWQIAIDYEGRTVDANPARISEREISWHDAKDGGNYTLDRKSGALTVIGASSTGGYFLHDQCEPEK
jgi:hypothetical protein